MPAMISDVIFRCRSSSHSKMLFFKLASSITYRKTPHNLCIKLGIKIRAQAGDADHQKRKIPHTKNMFQLLFLHLWIEMQHPLLFFVGFFSLFSFFNENGSLLVYCLYMFKSLVFVCACFNGSGSFLVCACFSGSGSFLVCACFNGNWSFFVCACFNGNWSFFVCACFNVCAYWFVFVLLFFITKVLFLASRLHS